MKELILLSCCKRKMESSMKAFELYDGNWFRVLKKHLSSNPEIKSELVIAIISAKYGFLKEGDIIDPYELKMTKNIAIEQQEENTKKLLKFISDNEVDKITTVMGKVYFSSINWIEVPVLVNHITGKMGYMLHDFKNYLDSKITTDIQRKLF